MGLELWFGCDPCNSATGLTTTSNDDGKSVTTKRTDRAMKLTQKEVWKGIMELKKPVWEIETQRNVSVGKVGRGRG